MHKHILHVRLVHEQTGHTHARTNTHASQQHFLLLPPALAKTCDNLTCTRATKWVTQSDSSSPNVQLLMVYFQCLEAVDRHRCESLVDLNKIDVIEGDVELGEELGNSNRRADAHDAWWQTSNCGTDELREDGLAKLLGGGAFHQENCGTAVGELGGIASMGSVAVGKESRLKLLQALVCGASTNSLVSGKCNVLNLTGLGVLDDGADGHNLVVKPASLLGDLGSPVGLGSEPVLSFAGDVEVLAHVFGCLAHRLHAVGGLRVLEDLVDEGALEAVAALRHALGTQGNTDIDGTNGNLVGNVLHSLQP